MFELKSQANYDMEELLKQIKASQTNNLYMLTLTSCLTLPDICGAVETPDEPVGLRYKRWYQVNVVPLDNQLTPEECYGFRCKILHQGRTEANKDTDRYSYLAFAEPGNNITVQIGQSTIGGHRGPKSIDLVKFCSAIITGVEKWMQLKAGTEPYETNIKKCINRRQGLPGLIAGVTYVY